MDENALQQRRSARPIRPFEKAVIRHALEEYASLHRLWHEKGLILCDYDEDDDTVPFDPDLVPSIKINTFTRGASEVPLLEWAGVTLWSSKRWFYFREVQSPFEDPASWSTWLGDRVAEMNKSTDQWRDQEYAVVAEEDEGPTVDELLAQDVAEDSWRLVSEFGELLEPIKPDFSVLLGPDSQHCRSFFRVHGEIATRVRSCLGATPEDEVILGVSLSAPIFWCQEASIELAPRYSNSEDSLPFHAFAPEITDFGTGLPSEYRIIPAAHEHASERVGIWLDPPTTSHTFRITLQETLQVTDRTREYARDQVTSRTVLQHLLERIDRNEHIGLRIE